MPEEDYDSRKPTYSSLYINCQWMEPFSHFRHATELAFLIISTLNHGDPRFIQAFEADCSLDITALQSLWTTVVQSLVVFFRNHVDVCPVGFPDMCGADDFDRDTKGSEPSEELGAYCNIQMSKEVLIIYLHDHNVLPEAVNDNADKFVVAF